MPVIVLSNHYTSGPLSIIQNLIPAGFELINLKEATDSEFRKNIPEADYILASGRLPINGDLLDTAPKLKMIQRTGVGLDSIDLNALKKRNIPLYVNSGINADSVAEHTILLMLAVLKRLPSINSQIREGIWIKQENGIRNRELKGKTVGIIGMGHIGQKVAKILSAFNVNLIYSDVCKVSEDIEKEYGLHYKPFSDLVSSSDIITLHCPLTDANRNLFNESVFDHMKKGAILINTARGGLINESDLLHALENNHLGGAGLDVFAKEPIPSSSPLLLSEKLVMTPHIGGVTYDSFRSMMQEAVNNICLYDCGKLSEIENRRYIF